MRLEEPRIPPLPATEWSDEIREILGRTGPDRDTPVFNIFSTVAHHPKLLKRWLVFGAHVLTRSTLPARDRELMILRVGWLSRAVYEWGQHVVIGKGVGISEDEILRIAEGPDAPGWDPLEATLLRAVDELHRDDFIGDATWKSLATRYETPQLLDLLFTVGQYRLVCMVLNSLGVQLDPGLEGFPDVGSKETA